MTSNHPGWSGYRALLLLIILVFAGALRWFGVSTVGYWTDEIASLSVANGWGLQFDKTPPNQIAPSMVDSTRVATARPISAVAGGLVRDDTHPPVYFWVLRVWEGVFGDEETATRSLSICCSLAAILMIYVLAERTAGASVALWAALLMAVASPQIMFSLETRDYMLALTLSLGATLAFLTLQRKPSTTAAGNFAVLLLAMMLTHYYCAGIAVALVLHGAMWVRGRSRRMMLVATLTASGLFLLIWGRQLHQQLPNFSTNTQWMFDTGPGRLHRLTLRFYRVPATLFATGLPDGSAVFVLSLTALPVLYWRRPELRLWVLWLVCTLGLIAGQDLLRSTTQLTLPRYLLFATPAAYILISAAVRGRWGWVLPAAGVVTALLSLQSAYAPLWKIDLRTPTEFVNNRLEPGDGLVISGPDPVFDGTVYAAFRHYLPKMPAATAVLTKPADAATLDRLRRCPHVWLLWMWPDHRIDRILPGYTAPENDQGHMPYFGDLMRGAFPPYRVRP